MTVAPTCPDYDWALQISALDGLAEQKSPNPGDIQYIGVTAGTHVNDCATCMDWFLEHDFDGQEPQLILGVAHGINQMIIDARKQQIQRQVARPRRKSGGGQSVGNQAS